MDRKKIIVFGIFILMLSFYSFTFVNLRDTDDNLVNLSSVVKNKIIIIDFFATTCHPCKNELPHLKQLYDSLKNDKLELYLISEDGSNVSNDDVKKFLKENYGELKNVHILRDIYHQQYVLNQEKKGPIAIPRNVLLKNGKVVVDVVGYHEDTIEKLHNQIANLLNGLKKTSLKKINLSFNFYDTFNDSKVFKSMVRAFLMKNRILVDDTNGNSNAHLIVQLKKIGSFEMVKVKFLDQNQKEQFYKGIPIYDSANRMKKTLEMLKSFVKFYNNE